MYRYGGTSNFANTENKSATKLQHFSVLNVSVRAFVFIMCAKQ